MKRIRESAIEDYTCDGIRKIGREIRKVKWIGRRGAPDRKILGGPWIEFKRPGETLQAHQVREIASMKVFGEEVWVVDSFEVADLLLAHLRSFR